MCRAWVVLKARERDVKILVLLLLKMVHLKQSPSLQQLIMMYIISQLSVLTSLTPNMGIC